MDLDDTWNLLPIKSAKFGEIAIDREVSLVELLHCIELLSLSSILQTCWISAPRVHTGKQIQRVCFRLNRHLHRFHQ
ncbi:unnamed protein product [Calypogeia fissa]